MGKIAVGVILMPYLSEIKTKGVLPADVSKHIVPVTGTKPGKPPKARLKWSLKTISHHFPLANKEKSKLCVNILKIWPATNIRCSVVETQAR